MHFGENQLSRSLIGLSPLPTPHPPGFQPWWGRASTESYPRFTLDMARSPRFSSTACDSNALFRLASATTPPQPVNLATRHDTQSHSANGTPSPHPNHGSDGLTAHGFRHSCTTPHRGTFHLSLTVLVHYRSPGRI